jgi:hypothetical protein
MNETVLGLVVLLAGTGGAAWGARGCGADGWRGAVVAAVAGVLTSALYVATGIENIPLWIACNLLLAAIIGRALKLSLRQTAITMATSVLIVIIAALVFSFVAHVSADAMLG